MTTVVGDIVIDVSGLPDTDPFTDPRVESIEKGVRVVSGMLRTTAWQVGGFVTLDAPSGEVYSAEIEIGGNQGDAPFPVLLNSSNNGYGIRCNYDSTSICRFDEGDVVSPVIIANQSPGLVPGDRVKIQLDESTGEITAYKNDVLYATHTDTTYTGLRAGYLHTWGNNGGGGAISWAASGYSTTPAIRKSSTFDIETTLSGTVTSATLDGNAITVDSQTGTTVTLTDSDGSITTSGEYDLVLTDDSADPDETISVQVNVVGLSSNKLRKDGGILASLTDVEYIIMTGAAGSRAINQNDAGLTTDASGDTAVYEVTDTALNSGDSVFVVAYSDSEGAGIPFSTTLGLI